MSGRYQNDSGAIAVTLIATLISGRTLNLPIH